LLEHQLKDIVGSENVSTDPEILQAQAIDYSWMAQYFRFKDLYLPSPEIAVWPTEQHQVAEVLQLACDYRIPVTPRGGGSGTQGGTFALYGGISLDLTRLNRLIKIDKESLTVTAEAGIDGLLLEETLNQDGLTLAHYPGSLLSGATLGGYLAARGSGVVSTKYGKAEDMVLQVAAAVPPGKLVSTLPVPNHASGPGLLQLLVGSEGTLGVITEATMRIDPVPEKRVFLSFEFESVHEGLGAGRDIMTSRWRPASMRLYDEADTKKLGHILNLDLTGAMLLVMCDGEEPLADLEAEAISKSCVGHGAVDLGPDPCKTWWDGKYEPFAKGKAPEPPTIFGTTDTCCTYDKINDLYNAKRRVIEEGFSDYGARYTAHFSHWYPWGTMVYDRFYVEDGPDDWREALELHDRLWDVAVRTSLAHGGVVNEHHGIGVKLGRFIREQSGEMWPLLLAIKNAWDPDGLMNPGKLGFGPPR
jgi:alkyldihydroxyacetonephosphate synthase